MANDSLGKTAQYEAIYRGARDATFSIFSGVMWVFLGIFGVGLLWMTTTALTNGTATLATFLLALFGVGITVLAGDELFHRLLGGTPIF
jgi:apolipoprotein N-acyltransferase